MQTAVFRNSVLLCDKRKAFFPKLNGEVMKIARKVCDNKQQHTFDVPCVSRIRQEDTHKGYGKKAEK